MKKFGTAINCIDGRVQIPVIDFLKNNYGIDYVDIITAPGVNKLLAEENPKAIEQIKRAVEISIKNHNSKIIAIAGHFDCAGNPFDNETQFKHIFSGIKLIKSWGFKIKIIGLWVDENLKVSEIKI